ncbi:MAG: alpha-amylase family glycosyl hydrolase [Burkholderiales bacterium]
MPSHSGVIAIPVSTAQRIEMRYAPLAERDRFDPSNWRTVALTRDAARPGWFEIDVDALHLPDGKYEYEFVLDNRANTPVADPFAVELTRFGGYRGVFRIAGGRRTVPAFSWEDELPAGRRLPQNNEIVIYELPLRWTAARSDFYRQIGLGDFESLLFEQLDQLTELGVNTIELLPVQDSPDTLNWGYGTRFFFAPDIDMGSPVDMKFFVKSCHKRGIRVLLDVVMNHARACPLEQLAPEWFFLQDRYEEGDRPDWGGRVFRYRSAAPDGRFAAREFHYRMAEFWVREYHVDGFRIDEFKGIDHWEFIQTFRERAQAENQRLFPGRPFIVIAEDSWRRAVVTQDTGQHPNGRKVVDAIWNFAFMDEGRKLMRNLVRTQWGEPSRRQRIEALISGSRMWDDWDHRLKDGFGDMGQAVNYLTSHDVQEEGNQRFVNYILGDLMRLRWLGSGSVENVREAVDHIEIAPERMRHAHAEALERSRSAFALLMTAVGIPMLLAGEEFGDVHDLHHGDWQLKMSDPVDWSRRFRVGHRELRERVSELIRLRTATPALQRNELEFFYFHPAIDESDGVRVFAYCRTAGLPLGSDGQVVVLANCGQHDFPAFDFPWPWRDSARLRESGPAPGSQPPHIRAHERVATVALASFQVRVFAT